MLLLPCFCLVILPVIVVGQVRGVWNYGGDGMSLVSVAIQSQSRCLVELGQVSLIADRSALSLQVHLPPGEFPLTAFCENWHYYQGGIRASISINGSFVSPSASEWRQKHQSSYYPGYPQSLTCFSQWTAADDIMFSTNGGRVLTERTVWPCWNEVLSPIMEYSIFSRIVRIPNFSLTARKVTVGVAADDFIAYGNIGPFSFLKGNSLNSYWHSAIFFSVYLEPGVYPLLMAAANNLGWLGMAAAIQIDGVTVAETGHTGWFASASNPRSVSMTSLDVSCIEQSLYWSQQFQMEMGADPKTVWAHQSVCSQNTSIGGERAYFLYNIDVRPRSEFQLYEKVDFQFVADNEFIMRIDSSVPYIKSFDDGVFSFELVTKYSTYLRSGIYQLKFSVANYYNTAVYNPGGLIGIISQNGILITTTNSKNGKWLNSTFGFSSRCRNENYWNFAIAELLGNFPGNDAEFIGPYFDCNNLGGVTHLYYILDTRNVSNAFSLDSSSPITPSLRDVISLEQSTSKVQVSSQPLSRTQRPLTRTLPHTRIKSLTSQSQPADNRINVINYIKNSNLIWTLLGAGAIFFMVIVAGCVMWRRYHRKSSSAAKGVDKPKERQSSPSLPASNYMAATDNPTETADFTRTVTAYGGTTVFTTEMRNAFSVPGYLSFVLDKDFTLMKKLTSGGGGDIYFGKAITIPLTEFGETVIVKQMHHVDILQFYQELSVTCYLQTCKNIIRLLGFSEHPSSLILKVYKYGSLKTLINSRPILISKKLAHGFLRDISMGLLAMHKSGFVHCDIKSDNVLIDMDNETRNYYCVICDFGVTQVVEQKVLKVSAFKVANQMGVSLLYAAPEVFRVMRAGKQMRDFPCDIYALGVLGMEMVTCQRPKWKQLGP